MSAQSPNTNRYARRIGWAIGIAVTIHLVLAIVLLTTPLRKMFTGEGEANKPVAAANGSSDTTEPVEETEPATVPKEEPQELAEPRSPEPPPGEVRDQIASALNDAEDLAPEENLGELSRLTNELNEVASETGVQEIAEKMEQWTGVGKRADQPVKASDPENFDFETAQLHEVRRKEGKNGGWVYESVLLDSTGNTIVTEMDAENGETAYNTMQILKSSPLAEKIYRKIAMPMIDQIINANQQAAKMQEEIARIEREQSAAKANPPAELEDPSATDEKPLN